MTPPKPVRHLTTEQLAERLGVGLTTLRDWRRDKRGPAFIKEGEIVRYREIDIEAWEKTRLVRT